MLVLGTGDRIEDLTATAELLLAKFELPNQRGEALPAALSTELRNALLGDAIMWRAPREHGAVLGCTRYWLGEKHHLLLMREITERQRAAASRMHQQRLEEAGKLIAHIAHDLRAPLASIVYNADLLARRTANDELVSEIQLAAANLKTTIAGLLDFVRLGPPVSATTSLRALCDRVSSLLRPVFRAGKHELIVNLSDGDACVRGNVLGIEQIFVNLLMNAIEASAHPARVEISSDTASLPNMVLVRVRDDGPGIPHELRDQIFDAFVTTKQQGTGLGLTRAREIAQSLGGRVVLEETLFGCSFAVLLPIAEAA